MNHFVTLFNYNFLPQGLAMLNSLKSNSNCIIWIICLDEKVYEFLYHATGLCGHVHHPSVINITAIVLVDYGQLLKQ